MSLDKISRTLTVIKKALAEHEDGQYLAGETLARISILLLDITVPEMEQAMNEETAHIHTLVKKTLDIAKVPLLSVVKSPSCAPGCCDLCERA